MSRRSHYREFYESLCGSADFEDDGRPVLVALGNCQAESHRLMLDGDDVRGVRVPPVFELEAADLAPLRSLLARAAFVVAQPVVAGYRGLPLGTAELLRHTAAGCRVALIPSLRFAGQHPFHVVVHPPHLVDADPPVVPYHDVRMAVRACWAAAGRRPPCPPALTVLAVRAVAADSVAELERRQVGDGGVAVGDLFAGPDAPVMRTVNHPGNEAFERVAVRLRAALGLEPRPPGVDRPLLDSIIAPVDSVVAEAFPKTEPRDHWVIEGVRIEAAAVAEAHLAFYDARPDVLAEVIRRSARLLDHLGLTLPPGLA